LNFEVATMAQDTKSARDLRLLSEIWHNPDATQANLAARLGVAIGTVNWHMRRLVAKGYIKAKRVERRKLRYIITPEGLALRARLTVAYVENQMALYRATRARAKTVLKKVKDGGYQAVWVDGDGDIADVCRLTCLEQGVSLAVDGAADGIPHIVIESGEIKLCRSGLLAASEIASDGSS
jgi:DNA-binding MarR family transcriptional regulator